MLAFDGGADRAHLGAVAGQVVADAGREPARLRAARDQELVARLVDGKGAADRNRGTAGRGEDLERSVHAVLVDAAGHVDEGVLGFERMPGCERDRSDPRSLAGGAEIGLRPDPENSDAPHVALEQGVHRLSRRERDERDAPAVVAELCEEVAQRSGDPSATPAASCEVGTQRARAA